jgi:hypothetical protein
MPRFKPKHDGSDMLNAANMKTIIFLNVMPCNMIEVQRCFVGTYDLHLQDQRVSQASNQQDASVPAAHMHAHI